ncbi:MAG: hypothetical protein GF308_00180 [Candidatus Heimdallarchaeota archaeon]|nr:hypothetical protein [Candidatus Heimdallarchaeota archaeon]
MKLLIKTKKDEDGKGYLNKKTMEKLAVVEGSVIGIADEISGSTAYCCAYSAQIPEDVILVDESLSASIGLGDNFEANVSPYPDQSKSVEHIYIKVLSSVEIEKQQELVTKVQRQRKNVISFLDGRPIFLNFQFKIGDIKYQIDETDPPLLGGDFSIVDISEIEGISLVFDPGKLFFNALLIVDKSKSMAKEDVSVKNIETSIRTLKQSVDSQYVNEFLDKFKKEKVRRIDAAILAVLMFLHEKVARGKGEKISILYFNDKAIPFKLHTEEEKTYIDFTNFREINEVLFNKIVLALSEGVKFGTLLCRALREKSEMLLENMGVNSPTMVIILTDGRPNSSKCVKRVIKERWAEKENLVLYSIGIGERKNIGEKLLKSITKQCRGDYYYAGDMSTLLKWYSELAKEFSLKVKREENEEGEENSH